MALSEIERKRVEKAAEAFLAKHRPPAHVRPKLDLAYRLAGQSIEVFEVVPHFQRPHEKFEHSVAKATYVKTHGTWKEFWRRADLKWYRYPPCPVVGSPDKFFELVAEDKHACFFG